MARACPTDYADRPDALRDEPALEAETLYVVGGLYGNPEALDAILAMRAAEARAGRAVTLLFNGDFHWFDVSPPAFAAVGAEVARHPALRGNVEAELWRALSSPDGEGLRDCGCAYPDYVEPGVPERSNAIFTRLAGTAQALAAAHGGPRVHAALAALEGLPNHRVARVGGLRIGIVHGDPESLAGWALAEEALREEALGEDTAAAGAAPDGPAVPQTPPARVADWFRRAGVDAFAATHTCLPFARDYTVEGRPRLVINNGSAGMPNFRGDRRGLLTRISAHPAVPETSLYGTVLDGVRFDALPIAYDHDRWLARFEADWPPDSPAHRSYHRRIAEGPAYLPAQAVRGRVQALGIADGARRVAPPPSPAA